MNDVEERRTGKRSQSSLWRCTHCHHEFRTPIRTDRSLTRRCRCGRVYEFGPKGGDGKYLSTTELKSWDWL